MRPLKRDKHGEKIAPFLSQLDPEPLEHYEYVPRIQVDFNNGRPTISTLLFLSP